MDVVYEHMLMMTPVSLYIENSSSTDVWGWVYARIYTQAHVLV